MRQRFLSIAALTTLTSSLAVGCDRGPSAEAPVEPAQAPATQMPAVQPHSTTALPANHPPIPANGPGASTATPSAPEAAGLAWEPPKQFVAVAPANAMRKAQYKVTDSPEAPELIVHYFGPGEGGGIEQNIERWIQQVKQSDGSDSNKAAKRESFKSQGGVQVHTVDVSGTFASNMPGQATGPQSDSRLLGAIAEGPQGAVFFKLVGPREAVSAAHPGFEALVKSIHPK